MEYIATGKATIMAEKLEKVGAAAFLAECFARSNGIPVEEVTPEYAKKRLEEVQIEAVAQAEALHLKVDKNRSVEDIKNDIRLLIAHSEM